MSIIKQFKGQTPDYVEIVEKYELGMLKGPADFSLTESGDLVVTKDGNLKWGHDKYNAMHRLVRRWCANAATLEVLLKIVSETQASKILADTERGNIAALAGEHPSLFGEKFRSLSEQVEADVFGSAACAGAVMVVVYNLLERFNDDLSLKKPPEGWRDCAPLIAGFSFGEVVWAAANNFRHHDEWARTNPPSPQQLRSIRVIAAVLDDELIAPNGDRHPFRRNVCVELIEAAGCGNIDTMADKVFQFGKVLAG